MDAQRDQRDEATEGAQNVVDRVTAYHYSGARADVESELDEGLSGAGVEMDGEERERVMSEITELKQEEGHGTPVVERAEPAVDQGP